jgi:hypothetical protein
MYPRWSRRFCVVVAVVFVVSLVFPTAAGLAHGTTVFPKWWGALDVLWSFVLAILVIVLLALTKGEVGKDAEVAAYRTYRILIHVIFAFGLLYVFAGNRIVWINCLSGFAWRFWLLMYSLPAWIAAFSKGKPDFR